MFDITIMHWNWHHTLSINKHLLKNLTDNPPPKKNKKKTSYVINQMVFTIHRRTNEQKQQDVIFLFQNKHNMPALTPSLPQPVKFPGWKMHGCACEQYMFRSYDASTFTAMTFDENPFTCHTKKEVPNPKRSQVSQWVLLVFKWHRGREGVKNKQLRQLQCDFDTSTCHGR